jgi:hypothetical protein
MLLVASRVLDDMNLRPCPALPPHYNTFLFWLPKHSESLTIVPSLALCAKSTHLQMPCLFGNMHYVTKTFRDRAHVLRLLFKMAHLKMHDLRFCISLFRIRCRQASCRRLEQFSDCGCAHTSKFVDIVIMSLASTGVPVSKFNMDRTMAVRLPCLTIV